MNEMVAIVAQPSQIFNAIVGVVLINVVNC